MDPTLGRTVGFGVTVAGTILVLSGGVMQYYFGRRVEAVTPYRQPIRTATATVEVTVARCDPNLDGVWNEEGNYIGLGAGKKRLLFMISDKCSITHVGKAKAIFSVVLDMPASDAAAGKPVYRLADAAYAQVRFVPMPAKCRVLGGKAVLTVNSAVRVTLPIPAQTTTNGIIFARNLEDAFSGFPR